MTNPKESKLEELRKVLWECWIPVEDKQDIIDNELTEAILDWHNKELEDAVDTAIAEERLETK